MQRGYEREVKLNALIWFFFKLMLLLIVLVFAYIFLVRRDYTSRIDDPNYQPRNYVLLDETQSPSATPDLLPEVTPETNSEDSTLSPFATSTPTPDQPTAEPTPSPTPGPTSIAMSMYSIAQSRNTSDIPKTSETIQTALTKCYVSPADRYATMQVEGYAYDENSNFDGKNAAIYFIVVPQANNSQCISYLATNASGVTGIEHDGEGQNLSEADFQVFIDVGEYSDGVYTLGIVLEYKGGGKTVYGSYKFPETMTFTVSGGEVISPIPISEE